MSATPIVVADDDPDILELISLRLEVAGHRAIVARDGEEALAKVREHMPALCILDLQMPKLTGFQVVHRIRADDATRRIPVILLTASVRDSDVIEGLESGADDYLHKPFSPADLQARISSVLGLC